MTPKGATTALGVLLIFAAGFLSHVLYQRWDSPPPSVPSAALETTKPYRVSYVPTSQPGTEGEKAPDLPLLVARDVEQIRSLAGRQARVRGRVFRVGHSAKSNTYFLSFGPSPEALTAVIFANSVDLFEKNKQPPRNFENKDVELTGQIQNHPQYGLEMILESPKQIRILP